MKEKQTRIFKKQNGITLIALVITIIVLLILAGVAIKAVTGVDGILSKSSVAVEDYKENANNYHDSTQELLDYLKNALTGETETLDKTVGYSGTGTATDPYLIESIEDLVKFSQAVENGDDFDGKVVKLAQNLDFENPKSYIDATRTDLARIKGTALLTELTTGIGFYQIGQKNLPFSGTFDGQGHTIYNLYQNQNVSNLGFFGYVYNGNVKNLNVTGSVNAEGTNDTYQVGGVIGQIVSDSNIVLEKCSFNGEVKGTSKVGNVVGLVDTNYDAEIKNCTAMGSVKGNAQAAGIVGVVDVNNIIIKDCNNKAKVTMEGNARAGGIAAYISAKIIDILNCNNSGEIATTQVGSQEIAGIIGQAGIKSSEEDAIVNIKNCTNSGVIKAGGHSAGILGEINSEGNLILTTSDNRNVAEIISTTEQDLYGLAGILGHVGSDKNLTININKCVNHGNINGNINGLAGILGDTWSVGSTTVNALNCLNTGNIGITSTTDAGQFGGIIASLSSQSGGASATITATIKNCSNTGAIGTGSRAEIGGILGALWTGKAEGSNLDISNCVNVGSIAVTSDWGVGGIAGGIDSNITKSVTNSFYLENANYKTNLGTSKTADELKATGANSVLQTLNTEAGKHASDSIPYLTWKQNEGLYPVIDI